MGINNFKNKNNSNPLLSQDKSLFKNIKSIYITKNITKYLLQNKLLYIIKYNKSLQQKLNFSLNDYKKYSLIEIELKIADNGYGMDESTLFEAMKTGSKNPLDDRDSDDLGRFGLGLKTASFSQ